MCVYAAVDPPAQLRPYLRNAHTGNRVPVTSMEGLYDATTLCVPMGYGVDNWTPRSGVQHTAGGGGVGRCGDGRVGPVMATQNAQLSKFTTSW